jgi:hypothetical protein
MEAFDAADSSNVIDLTALLKQSLGKEPLASGQRRHPSKGSGKSPVKHPARKRA